MYGGALPSAGSGPNESDEKNQEDEEREPAASVSGIFLILQATIMLIDNNDFHALILFMQA